MAARKDLLANPATPEHNRALKAKYNLKENREAALGRQGPTKFTPETQEKFLRNLRKTGRMYEAAEMAGVSYHTVKAYMNKGTFDLPNRVEEALADYRDQIEREIHRRAVLGVPEPLLGGKDRDKIVTYVQRYSDRLLEFHAKRHIPEYRSTQQIDVNLRGGVIAVPAQAPSLSDWASAAAGALLPTVVDGEIIDVLPEEVEVPSGQTPSED